MYPSNGFSAKVTLSLLVAGERLSLRQVCPDRVYLGENYGPSPPTDAVIEISIDGFIQSSNVYLHQGIDGECVSYI